MFHFCQPFSEYFTAVELSEYAILWITESFFLSIERHVGGEIFVHVGGRSRNLRRAREEEENLLKRHFRLQSSDFHSHPGERVRARKA